MSLVSQTPRSRSATPVVLFILDITLRGIPSVRRRVSVPATIRLSRLHLIIQAAMPWTDTHLHMFTDGEGIDYGVPETNREFDPPEDERKCRLNQFLMETSDRISYQYDFGDSWDHFITLQSVAEVPKRPVKAVFLAGEGRCPPEDCGGAMGYREMLEALADKEHPEHKCFTDWLISGSFDPHEFDPVMAKLRVSSVRV